MSAGIRADAVDSALQVNGVDAVPFDTNGLKSGAFADDTIAPGKLTQPLTAGTAIATTSGTSHDFTGIPSWVKRITILFSGVSTNGTSFPLIQLGDSGGVEATGYTGISSERNSGSGLAMVNMETVGFNIRSVLAAHILVGKLTLTLIDGAEWIMEGTIGQTTGTRVKYDLEGSKTLTAALDTIRITTVNGTDTFDAGKVNILYE